MMLACYTFICIKDRTTARREQHLGGGATCPICQQPMKNMGKRFKTPKKNDDDEWEKIDLAVRFQIPLGPSLSSMKRRLKKALEMKAAAERRFDEYAKYRRTVRHFYIYGDSK